MPARTTFSSQAPVVQSRSSACSTVYSERLGAVGLLSADGFAHASHDRLVRGGQVLRVYGQRCTVYFLRDCLGHARRDQHGLLAALIRPDLQRRLASTGARSALRSVAHLDGRLGKVATMLEDAEPDILAFYACHPTDESRLQSLRATDPTGHAIALMRALTSRCEIREALSISVIERRAGPLRLVDSAQCR